MAIAKAHLALIQRVARGFLARCESNFVRDMHWYAAKIQSQVRFKIAYKKFWVLLQRRIWAAEEIQRNSRGWAARALCARKLKNHFDREMRRIKREHWEFKN